MTTRGMRVRRQIPFLTAAVMRALVVAMAIMMSKKRGMFPERRLIVPQTVLVRFQAVLVLNVLL